MVCDLRIPTPQSVRHITKPGNDYTIQTRTHSNVVPAREHARVVSVQSAPVYTMARLPTSSSTIISTKNPLTERKAEMKKKIDRRLEVNDKNCQSS